MSLKQLFADDVACAGCTSNRKTNDNWHFIGRFGLQPEAMSSTLGSSFIFEVGNGHVRGSGTLGALLDDFDRFKVTGEWLIEKNSYAFCANDGDEWVNQGAVGVAYQHLFCSPYIFSFDMGGTYSHAFSQQLGTVPCSNQSLVRRFISGSNAYDVSFGATFCSWYDGFISLYAVYDRIQYTRKYFPKIEIKGFGGGARIYQPLSNDFDLTAYIEIRQPYNYYEGDLNWRKVLWGYDTVFGLFASYTDGKKHLINDGKVGIQLSFVFGESPCTKKCDSYKGGDFDAWMRLPAVYKPKVLAIKDQDCIMTCSSPYPIISTLDALVFTGEGAQIDGGTLFFGSALEYSLLEGVPPGVSIDSKTGVITVPNSLQGGIHNFRIQVDSPCGQSSAPVSITVIDGPSGL